MTTDKNKIRGIINQYSDSPQEWKPVKTIYRKVEWIANEQQCEVIATSERFHALIDGATWTIGADPLHGGGCYVSDDNFEALIALIEAHGVTPNVK